LNLQSHEAILLTSRHEISLLVQKGWMKAERHGEVSHFGPAFPEMMQGGVEIAIGWLISRRNDPSIRYIQ
jgi:hypothetical protein